MNILLIDSPRVNYIDTGEYGAGTTQQGHTLEVTATLRMSNWHGPME